MIPGRMLHRLAAALCSPDMGERVVDAFFADFQREWLDAETFASRASALIRGYAAFGVVLAGCLMHDARHDFAGFRARALNRIAYYSFVVSLSLVAVVAPSWVRTGRVDWSDAARGTLWVGSIMAAIVIARYRSQYAERRALLPFFLAVGMAIAVMVFHPVNDGHGDVYKWLFHVSLTMAWPFLLKKQHDHDPAEAGHR